MNHDVYICASSRDKPVAERLVLRLEAAGYSCWLAPRDVPCGSTWGQVIVEAINSARLVVVLLSARANLSALVSKEVAQAVQHRVPVLPVRLEDVPLSTELNLLVGGLQFVDVSRASIEESARALLDATGKFLPQKRTGSKPSRTAAGTPLSKGYVFISYSRADSGFVLKLKEILRRRGYAYWDYSESERDYHNALYRELEEKIEGAAAFMSIVTDSWRETEWPAAEYIYSREAKVPIFVIQAKRLTRPMPIILNQQTRIDMSEDFERGAAILEHELDKKKL